MKYDLPPTYIGQIVEFILKNTSKPSVLVSQEAVAAAPAKCNLFKDTFEVITEANITGICKKISEINVALTNKSVKLNDKELKALLDLNHPVPVEIIEKCLSWDLSVIFPVIDYLRLLVIRQESLVVELEEEIFGGLIKTIKRDNVSGPLKLMVIRILVNISANPLLIDIIV